MRLFASTAQLTQSALMASSPQAREVCTTIHFADSQYEYPGARAFTKNPLIDALITTADRSLVALLTAPLNSDTLLGQVKEGLAGQPLRMQVLGDLVETPCTKELGYFETIQKCRQIQVEGYDRGNHTSSNFYGAVNLLSHAWRWAKRRLFRKMPSLEQEQSEACGGKEYVLTPKKTFEGMHRILHQHRKSTPDINELNAKVAEVKEDSIIFEGATKPFQWTTKNQKQAFKTFWERVRSYDSTEDGPRQIYWECLVNYHLADLPVSERGTDINPFYLQASEQARYQLDNGEEAPIYAISLDSQDTTSVIAVQPGISEFQILLVENFIEQKLAENEHAKFKLSTHFPIKKLLSFWNLFGMSRKAKKALKRLLKREEIIQVTSAHTHERKVQELSHELHLGRTTPLREITIPSLVDYSPAQKKDAKMYQDARALGIERMWTERNKAGALTLKIGMEYKGLDPEDLRPRPDDESEEAQRARVRHREVQAALAAYETDHGYMRARETIQELKKKYLWGLVKRMFRCSFFRNLFNFSKTISVIHMFNEAEHLIPFLKSLLHMMKLDEQDSADAVADQQIDGAAAVYDSTYDEIEGITGWLETEYQRRQERFDNAFKRGEEAAELTKFNKLYVRTEVDQLPEIFLGLKPGSRAHLFAVLAGLAASRAEFEYHRKRPTQVPNEVKPIEIPLT